MGKLYLVKAVLEEVVKKAPKYLKKYAPHMIIGTGGIGVGVAISQPGKKKVEEEVNELRFLLDKKNELLSLKVAV